MDGRRGRIDADITPFATNSALTAIRAARARAGVIAGIERAGAGDGGRDGGCHGLRYGA